MLEKPASEKRATSSPQEFRHEKVGLFVHDEVEDFYYPGAKTLDMSDLMAFHLQKVLPFSTQELLLEVFEQVEIKPTGSKVEFKNPDLAGYFEIKINRVRYDYPDPDVSQYRADVELSVEFKNPQHETIWRGIFNGEGVSFSSTDRNLTRFGREAGAALEDAFKEATSKMQKGVLSSQSLKEYFRWRAASQRSSP